MQKRKIRLFALSSFVFMGLLLAVTPSMAQQTPNGVVLMKADGKHIYHDKVVSKELEYYGWRRGPYIENKHTAFRLLLSAVTVGWFDPFSKKKYESVIQHFDDPKFRKGANHNFGTDAYHVGKMAGLGSPMFKVKNDWVLLPHFDKTDSIIVELLDTTLASPRYRVSYFGWVIDDKQKIDVVLEVYTTWEERHIHTQLKVTGFSGKVGAGMQPGDNVSPVKDKNAATIYHQGLIQKNTMLQAVHADPKYFDSFETDDQGEVMVLKNDSSGVMKWSFLYSWENEPKPLFEEQNWQEQLIYVEPSVPDSNPVSK